MATDDVIGADDSWYQDAVVYELHVRSFRDADGDGIGDFQGLTEKLDYLVDLGVTAIWILPFYPSPGRDDGYDIADYRGVNADYGNVRDVRELIRESHRRGLRVITELVCNHTSDQHPWFQRSRRARPGSRARNRYVWSDTPDKYRQARIIFQDFEPSNWTWDPVAQAYYWHRFYSHQPDLNFDDPAVHRDLVGAMDFWLEMGVDGLRLDAIPYLYEREGTNCENLPETHAFLRMLRAHIDERYPGRILLAEANQWPETAVAYFGGGRGDECHMAFHFPVMPRLYMALRREDRYPIVDILDQTPSIPETAQWALFLRNHDELTLEMVTDEERDFMYRVYADDPQTRLNLGIRRRLAPLMRNDRRRIELLNALLFSMPGTPFIYYGDEIGMGDNVYLGDRNGVRTPMQWSADHNAGFSSADPSRLCLPIVTDPEYHYTNANVATQKANPHSLLWWMKRLISLRKHHQAFGRGTMELLGPEDRRILAFLRRTPEERLLIVANLSRFAVQFALDLSEHAGWRPVELFGRSEFAPIGEDGRYPLTLAPHAFLWFELVPAAAAKPVSNRDPRHTPTVPGLDRWSDAMEPTVARALGTAIAPYLSEQVWFRGTMRQGVPVEIVDVHPFGEQERAALVLVRPAVLDGDQALYQLTLAFAEGDSPCGPEEGTALARSTSRGMICDASGQPWFGRALLQDFRRGRLLRGRSGTIAADSRAELTAIVEAAGHAPSIPVSPGSRNVALRIGGSYLKLYRRIEPGEHSEREIGRSLRRHPHLRASGLTVTLEYRRAGAPLVIGGVGPYVANEGTAWGLMVGAVGTFIDRAAAMDSATTGSTSLAAVLANFGAPPASSARAIVGEWVETVRLIGRRAAELHLALAAEQELPGFTPLPFGELYQRSLYQAIRGRFHDAVTALGDRATTDPTHPRAVDELAALGRAADPYLRDLLDHTLATVRIRIHGDLRLEHFLDVGGDVMIVDFEGDPTRPLSERRIPRPPLRDLAVIIASFVRVAGVGLDDARKRSVLRETDDAAAASYVLDWVAGAVAAVVNGYVEAAGTGEPALFPHDGRDAAMLLRALTIDALCQVVVNAPERDRAPAALVVPAIRALLE